MNIKVNSCYIDNLMQHNHIGNVDTTKDDIKQEAKEMDDINNINISLLMFLT